MAASLEAQGMKTPTIDEILSHHGLQREDVNRECSQSVKFKISVKIVNWKMVGRYLEISEEKLAAIQADNHTEEERRVVMLYTWYQKLGSQATYLSLMRALHQHQRRDLVEELCRMIKSEIMVKAKLHELEKRFFDLCHRLKSELLQKNIPVETILDSLTSLPMVEYDESIQAKLPQIEMATTITQLISQLDPLFTFIDYSLLNYIASNFGSAHLQGDMSSYIQGVQVFMRETTVDEVMLHWQGREISSDEFSELRIEIKANPKIYTLQQLQEFCNKYCATIKLSPVLSSIKSIKSLIPASSFFVVLLVPTAATIKVEKAIGEQQNQSRSYKFETSKKDCINKCGWTGYLKDHDSHLNISPENSKWLEGCEKTIVQCIFCRKEVHKRAALLKLLQKTLQPSDWEVVYDSTKEVCHKWRDVGDELKVDYISLKSIEECCKNVPEDCYRELLQNWIQSTGDANWIKLIQALRNRTVEFKHLSNRLEKERETDERVRRAEAIKEKYKRQRENLENLKAELSKKRAYINDKKEELERFSRDKEKQLDPVNDLSKLTTELEISGDAISSILKEITEAEEGQAKLIEQIGEAERQLKNTKDSMKECLISLQNQIRDLESVENVVLQEHGLGRTRRTPYQPEDYTRAGAVAGTLLGVGAGALIGVAGAASVAEVVGEVLVGSLLFGPIGLAGGLIAGAALTYSLNKERQRKEVEEKYTRLILRCVDAINDIKPQISDCEEQLEELKETVKSWQQ